MAGMNASPGIHHPGEQPVTVGALHEFLTSGQYDTEERMRQVVPTIVQTSMEEMQVSRRNLAAMVDRMNDMLSHLDRRVDAALTQVSDRHTSLTDEVQARDAQLREFFDQSQVKNTESCELVTNQVAAQINPCESEIANKLDVAVARLSAAAAAAVEDTNLKSHALYEEMRAQLHNEDRQGGFPSTGGGPLFRTS